MNALLAGFVASAVGCGILALAQQKPDPFAGTWRLNVAKSGMDMSSSLASKSETVVYRYENGEEIFSADAVTAKGEAEHTDYRAKFDGPYGTIRMTMNGKVASEGALQLRKLDTRTRLRIAMQKDGTLNGIIVRRLSEDGKTITSSILGFDKTGKIINTQTRIFEKVE
jgi:hypothetical protein